jgi:hypothetical protein
MPEIITGPPCHGGTEMQGPGPPGWGFAARLTTLFCEINYCFEIQRSENRIV